MIWFFDDLHVCDSCDVGYFMNTDGLCVQNSYVCEYGDAEVNDEFISSVEVRCVEDSCDAGYSWHEGVCQRPFYLNFDEFVEGANTRISVVCDAAEIGDVAYFEFDDIEDVSICNEDSCLRDESYCLDDGVLKLGCYKYVKRSVDDITVENARSTCTSGIFDMSGFV